MEEESRVWSKLSIFGFVFVLIIFIPYLTYFSFLGSYPSPTQGLSYYILYFVSILISYVLPLMCLSLILNIFAWINAKKHNLKGIVFSIIAVIISLIPMLVALFWIFSGPF